MFCSCRRGMHGWKWCGDGDFFIWSGRGDLFDTILERGDSLLSKKISARLWEGFGVKHKDAREGSMSRKEGHQGRRDAKEGRMSRKEGHQGRKDIKEGKVLRKDVNEGRKEGRTSRKEGCQGRKDIKEERMPRMEG